MRITSLMQHEAYSILWQEETRSYTHRALWHLCNATVVISGYCAEHAHKGQLFIFLAHSDSGSFGCKYPQALTKFYLTVADSSEDCSK